MTACQVEGCGERRHARGVCKAHYEVARTRGCLPPLVRAANGTGHVTRAGYRLIRGRPLHRMIVEAALGRPMPRGALIHHVDGNPSNNAHGNLVVCQDQTYHLLLHQRTRALRATGNANARKCPFCKRWDSPDNMKPWGRCMHHDSCRVAYDARRRGRVRVQS